MLDLIHLHSYVSTARYRWLIEEARRQDTSVTDIVNTLIDEYRDAGKPVPTVRKDIHRYMRRPEEGRKEQLTNAD